MAKAATVAQRNEQRFASGARHSCPDLSQRPWTSTSARVGPVGSPRGRRKVGRGYFGSGSRHQSGANLTLRPTTAHSTAVDTQQTQRRSVRMDFSLFGAGLELSYFSLQVTRVRFLTNGARAHSQSMVWTHAVDLKSFLSFLSPFHPHSH